MPGPDGGARCLDNPTGLPLLPDFKDSIPKIRVPRVFDDSIWQVFLHVLYLDFCPFRRLVRQPDLSGASVECSVDVKIA